jgi:ATP-dependent exoDNAse (exonuclease V) beta subunit
MQHTKHHTFTVYQASAGSGKTYNLAKEFIKICLQRYPYNKQAYRNILAITFTNKAVGEMKERILRFLAALAEGSNDLLLKQLDIALSEEIIRERSADILQRILHDYSNLSICTIDSLFQKLLQSFAVDLQIPLNHKLELESHALMQMIVDLILSRLGHDLPLTETLLGYSYARMENEKSWQIEKDLIDVGEQIYQESALVPLKQIRNIDAETFGKIIRSVSAALSDIRNRMRTAAQKALQLLADHDLQYHDLYRAENGIGKKFYHIAQGKFTVKELESNTYIRETLEDGKWYAKNSPHKHAIDAIASQLKDYYLEITTRKDSYLLYTAIAGNIHAVALLNEISRTAELLRQTDRVIHISEANFRIFESIEHEPVAYIFERIGQRYHYIFIDEFQDTSSLQWQNLLPFVTELMTTPIKGEEQGKAILFGDAKQAIYRFRGGNVRQFTDLPCVDGSQHHPILRERENIIKAGYQKIVLDHNFRSKAEIVDFNNRLFTTLTAEFATDIYHDCIQKANQENKGGGVSVSFLRKSDEKNIPLPSPLLHPVKYDDFINSELIRIIAQLRQDNYSYRDIAVLVRGNDLGAQLASVLLEAGIPAISNESLLLNKNEEVCFLIALLTCLSDNTDEVSRLTVIDFIAIRHGLAGEQYFPLAKKEKQQHFLRFIREAGYAFYPHRLVHYNLYSRIENLLQIFGLSPNANPFILAFLETVAEFVLKNQKNAAQFLDFWQEKKNKLSLSNPKGIDAVTVMTVHQSKGLEFPVVILPQKRKKAQSAKKWIHLPNPQEGMQSMLLKTGDLKDTSFHAVYELEKQESSLDELNINYVAFTRARDRLYCIAQEGEPFGDDLVHFLRCSLSVDPIKAENPFVERYLTGVFAPNSAHAHDATPSADVREITVGNDISGSWSAKISLSLHGDLFRPQSDASSTDWGNCVHDCLSMVRYRKDILTAKASINHRRMLSPDGKKALWQIIEQLFEGEHAALLFGATDDCVIETEVPVLDPAGQLYRIDRLIIRGDRCTVFDYKTGSSDEAHLEQIHTYARLLSAMDLTVENQYILYIKGDGKIGVIHA